MDLRQIQEEADLSQYGNILNGEESGYFKRDWLVFLPLDAFAKRL